MVQLTPFNRWRRSALGVGLATLAWLMGARGLCGWQVNWHKGVTEVEASLRGLAAVSDDVAWASGSQGTVLRTIDGGQEWRVVSPPDSAELDFRCLWAWDDERAIVASAGERDVIFRTENGGRTWEQVYEDPDRGAFFDGLAFWNEQQGVLMGDPLNGILYLLETRDAGRTWQRLPADSVPSVREGEAGFAASNSNLAVWGQSGLLIGLGGAAPGESEPLSRIVFRETADGPWQTRQVPLRRSESSGIFSVVPVGSRWVAVGGDYRREADAQENCALGVDGGNRWLVPAGNLPSGFRSAVTATGSAENALLVALGPNGGDVSWDLGERWQRFTGDGFHAAQFSPSGMYLWACGSQGRVGRLPTDELRRLRDSPSRSDR